MTVSADRRPRLALMVCVTVVGFVAAAVSMPMGGCRAIIPVVVDVVSVTVELAVL